MRSALFGLITLLVLPASVVARDSSSKGLLEARKGHRTRLTKRHRDSGAMLPPPPSTQFKLVKYPTKLGRMSALLSGRPEGDDKKRPAMIWITGGFPPGGGGPYVWVSSHPDNDQSAAQYRHAGFVMMYPSFRGAYGNPGSQEYFYGEVDDVIAAHAYLKTVDYVDPDRIYLGGHSTGGTLALLVAAATDKFQAVISFGPVDVPKYEQPVPFRESKREWDLRSPIKFLDAIQTTTFVVEGEAGNARALRALDKATENPRIRFFEIERADHFDIMAPLNRLFAERLIGKTRGRIDFARAQSAYDGFRSALREANDLETLAAVRREGLALKLQTVSYVYHAQEIATLHRVAAEAEADSFQSQKPKEAEWEDGDTYFVFKLRKSVKLDTLSAVFSTSKKAESYAKKFGIEYVGWYVVKPGEE